MITLFKVKMNEIVPEKVKEVLMSGFIGQGEVVEEFEKALKDKWSNDLILTLNSATSAEHLALHMLKKPVEHRGKVWPGIQEDDEVLATALTCTATNFPILANGLKIRWVDVDENNLNMNLDDLARKISPKTKVIMFVHWGGYPVDLDRVKEIQLRAEDMYGFKPAVIEDCAHAIGSTYKGRQLGNHGNICTFSFQAIKHMTSVDGGMLIVPHQELYNRGKLLRWYGIDRDTNRKDFRCELDVEESGFKFHMNDINACIGLHNLVELDDTVKKHQENADYYYKEFADFDGITLLEKKPDRESSYWIFSMLVENQDGFMKKMKEKEIMVSRVHERNDIHTCVKDYKSILPSLDEVVKHMICIPAGWWVTKEDREYIYNTIKKGW